MSKTLFAYLTEGRGRGVIVHHWTNPGVHYRVAEVADGRARLKLVPKDAAREIQLTANEAQGWTEVDK